MAIPLAPSGISRATWFEEGGAAAGAQVTIKEGDTAKRDHQNPLKPGVSPRSKSRADETQAS